MDLYTSLFKNSRIVKTDRFQQGEPGEQGTIKHAVFSLNGQEFMAMDGGREHAFTFNPAVSLFVNCESQEEVDDLWEKISASGGQPQQCGWIQDRFGVSWQIIPTALMNMLGDKDPAKSQRVMKAMLAMQKIDIEKLTEAYHQH